jgi:hypothetical protein
MLEPDLYRGVSEFLAEWARDQEAAFDLFHVIGGLTERGTNELRDLLIGAVHAPPAPFVPPQHHSVPGYVLLLTGFGSGQEHDRLVTQVRERVPTQFDLVTTMPYVELQQLLDAANAWGSCCYEKGMYLEDLADPVIDVVTGYVPRKNSPMSMFLLYRLDGAYSQAGDAETAFSGGRSPRYSAFIVGVAPDSDQLAADRGWVRSFWQALRPHAIGSGDGYVNGTSEYSGDRVRAGLRRREVRTAGHDQGRVRPGQPISPRRQHRTSLRAARRRWLCWCQSRHAPTRGRDASGVSAERALLSIDRKRSRPGAPLLK